MGLTRGQLFEVGFWLTFALGAFALTYQFNLEIEIYEFGAYGWPRGVILCIVIAVLGQVYHDVRFGQAHRAVIGEDEERPQHDASYILRMLAALGLPLAYALLLQPLGFYALTPLFILAFLYAAGERRWPWLLGVTAFIYGFLLIAFARLLYVGLPTGNVRPFYDFSNWLLVVIR